LKKYPLGLVSASVEGSPTIPRAEEEMIQVDEREQIRRAYFVEQQGMRRIARELGHSRRTIRKALASAEPDPADLA
jgi:DNA-binding NtrC family response regulator